MRFKCRVCTKKFAEGDKFMQFVVKQQVGENERVLGFNVRIHLTCLKDNS